MTKKSIDYYQNKTGHHLTTEHRALLSKLHTGMKASEETKKKMKGRIAWNKGKHANPEHVRKVIASNHWRPTKPEKYLGEILERLYPNEYKYTGDGNVILGSKIPDFTNVNGKKQVIELYGDYWHRNDNIHVDINRYKEYGYSCLIIWEHELGNPELVGWKVRAFHDGFPVLIEESQYPENYVPKGDKCGTPKGSKLSPEHRANIGKGNIGRIVSPETREKIRQSLMGHKVNEETRRKISEANSGKESWNKGMSPSEETRQKIAQSLMGNEPWNKGKKGLQVAWNKGLKLVMN